MPVWLLGSSDFSARLAAELGLPFAFASHFAPGFLLQALDLYRTHFQPSAVLKQPRVAVGVNLVAADTDQEAFRLFTSIQQAYLNLVRGTPRLIPPPVDSMEGRWNPFEKDQVERMTRCSAVGSLNTVQRALTEIASSTNADELILTGHIAEQAARLRSFELAAALQKKSM